MIAADCHPTRPRKHRGLCGACYERARRRQELERIPPIIPSCHPDRRHQARGLCKPCYGRTRDRRAGRLRQLYGLTREAFDAMVDAQGGRCRICGRNADLVVDHEHGSMLVRGLLCGTCNSALGLFGDDPVVIEAAARYLRAVVRTA